MSLLRGVFSKIVILLTLALSANSYCQPIEHDAKFKDGDAALYKFLTHKFAEEHKKHDLNVCFISVIFAKFTIDSTGQVQKMSFSKNNISPQVFKDILKSVILSTNGSWIPATLNGKRIESKPFLLPLIFEMQAGCNPQTVSASPNIVRAIPNETATALRFILDFEDDTGEKISQLDCVLLEPLRIFSIN